MKAISLWEPWASLIALGHKTIETRSWETPYRGVLLIHAAKKWDGELKEICAEWPFSELLPDGWEPALGKIVASTQLADCHEMTVEGCEKRKERMDRLRGESLGDSIARDWLLGDWKPGRYAWVLHLLSAFPEPIEVRGAQGIWNVPAEIEPQIREQDAKSLFREAVKPTGAQISDLIVTESPT